MKKEVLYLVIAVILVIGALTYKRMEISGYEKRDEKIRLEKSTRQMNLNNCLSRAESNWWDTWELNCTSNFKYDENGDVESCNVPSSQAERIDSAKQKEKANCVEMYK